MHQLRAPVETGFGRPTTEKQELLVIVIDRGVWIFRDLVKAISHVNVVVAVLEDIKFPWAVTILRRSRLPTSGARRMHTPRIKGKLALDPNVVQPLPPEISELHLIGVVRETDAARVKYAELLAVEDEPVQMEVTPPITLWMV